MSQIQKTMNVTFSMLDCKCVSFVFSEFAIGNKDIIEKDKFQFLINLSLNISPTDKNISVNVNCVLLDNREGQKTIATLDAINVFNVVNFDEVVIKNADQLTLPDRVLLTFFSIATSNVRGMYAVKLENSIY